MSTSTWKHTERHIAKRLNGTRTGPQGRAIEDVTTSRYVVEIKHRKRLPDWIHSAMRQAQGAAARKPDHLALVVLHEAGQRHDSDLVVIRLRDFQEWFGDVEASESERG